MKDYEVDFAARANDCYLVNPHYETLTLDHVFQCRIGAENDKMTFALIDGGTFELDKSELFSALSVLTSVEFEKFCDACIRRVNAYESINSSMHELEACVSPTYEMIYTLYRRSKRYGRYSERARALQNDIEDKVGNMTWINACRLYECLFGIPREHLR